MADRDGRNFRSFYYETLGLRNVEQKKALEILLKDDPIDIDRVATFSSRFSLPAVYRSHVWKILLGSVPKFKSMIFIRPNKINAVSSNVLKENPGVLPPYQAAHAYVMQQRHEQCEDLKHALIVMQQISHDSNVIELISKMYTMEEGGLRLIAIPEKLRRNIEILRAVVRVFVDIFEDEVDLYWLSVKFVQLQQHYATQYDKAVKLIQHYLQTEDNQLWKHLSLLNAFEHLPHQRWFESSFAEDLPDSCMERVWDKVVAGSSKVLVIVGVAILIVYRHYLLSAKTPQAVTATLNQPCQEDTCVIIVNKAMELWDKRGSAVISDIPTVH